MTLNSKSQGRTLGQSSIQSWAMGSKDRLPMAEFFTQESFFSSGSSWDQVFNHLFFFSLDEGLAWMRSTPWQQKAI
jgi:hypothetical protein